MFDKDYENYLLKLCEREHWNIVTEKSERKNAKSGTEYRVSVPGPNADVWLPLRHPYRVHLTLYRMSADADEKFKHLRAAHGYLWPDYEKTWNDWDERRFRAHCERWRIIVLAGGASTGKSDCLGRIACLFWLSDPTKNCAVVGSTTLTSAEKRIWGYVTRFVTESVIDLSATVKVLTGKPPAVIIPKQPSKIHGIFAEAAKMGEPDKTIATLIGRHPKRGLMMILDEADSMPPAIIEAIPNMEKGVDFFQLWAIANSNSKYDLHGGLATPKNGWESIDFEVMDMWETVHKRGICLYFNPYKSPAITEKEPVKRAALARFLPTRETIAEDLEKYGKDSDAFWRFTMGFWRSDVAENVIVSSAFLKESQVFKKPEWSG